MDLMHLICMWTFCKLYCLLGVALIFVENNKTMHISFSLLFLSIHDGFGQSRWGYVASLVVYNHCCT